MTGLARSAVRRPRLVIGLWLAVMGVFGALGTGVEERLHRGDIDIPGSGSARAADLADERFGVNHDLVILLEGPKRQLERQGPRLVKTLSRRPAIDVLDPWSAAGASLPRPGPGKALLIVRSRQPFEEVSREVVPAVRADVERATGPPVEARVSGYADVARGIYHSQVDAIRRAELVAAPLLVIILLLVFRAAVPMLLLLVAGAVTIGAGRGVLELVNRLLPLDAVALNLAAMLGLALGVDYALLLVSRFRSELEAGASPAEAGMTAVGTAGRTIVLAGAALALAMGVALLLAPGALLTSASFGLVVGVVLSVLTALTALPAALVLLGHGINRWSRPRDTSRAGLAQLALRTHRRPALAAGLVLLMLILLSIPGIGLETGPPDPRVLPASSPERKDYEAIGRSLGPGWTAPYEITVATANGPITAPRPLAALDRWQRGIAKDTDVLTVMGPATIQDRSAELRGAPSQLRRAAGALKTGETGLARLQEALGRAEEGSLALQAGLVQAAEASGGLESGAGALEAGNSLLHGGLGVAHNGAAQLLAGLAAAHGGVGDLVAALSQARTGVQRLNAGLVRAREEVRAGLPRARALAEGLSDGATDLRRLREPAGIAESNLEEARRALERMLPTSQADPEYREVFTAVATALAAVSGRNPQTGEPVDEGYRGLDASLDEAATGVGRAADGVEQIVEEIGRLDAGLAELSDGTSRLDAAMGRLLEGATALQDGVGRLTAGEGELTDATAALVDGTGRLGAGITQLRGGAGQLEAGLASGGREAQPLAPGLRRARVGVGTFREGTGGLGQVLADSERLAPMFESGYATLAAIDANRPARMVAGFALNVDRGGTAARILVVERGDPRRKGNSLRSRLEQRAGKLERSAKATVGIGGPAAVLQDFDQATSGRGLLLLGVLSLCTYLVLLVAVRSLVLPLLTVLLSVLTVYAALGLLTILFQGDSPLLGGPGFTDAIMASGVFTLAFGLSVDYQVFLLARMREGYDLTGTTDGAIDYALRHTARVISGAALIMTGVFVAFAIPDISSMRQLGIGLSFAVLLDATLVRLVLLPATIQLVGERAWGLPGWLDRRLPDVAAH